jgi:hypothetical protein
MAYTEEHGADRLLREIGRQAEGKAPSSGSRAGIQKWPIPPAELRRQRATSLYETEMLFCEEGLSDFVYDEENDLFRFEDDRFAFSRAHADLKLLEEQGYSA